MNMIRLREKKMKLTCTCPFCRKPVPNTQAQAEWDVNAMRRINANDPVEIRKIGMDRFHEGD
jgi:hypothetical protein